MTRDQIIFEAVRMLLQLVGAMAVAWLTVWLALGRFKSEKAWERRLTAYTDVLAALGEMRIVDGRWIDLYLERRDLAESDAERLRERYGAARRRFDEVAAMAALILPDPVNSLLEKLTRGLESNDADDYFGRLDSEYGLLTRAMRELTKIGQEDIGVRKNLPKSATEEPAPAKATTLDLNT